MRIPDARFAGWMLMAAALDLLTKQVAGQLLAGRFIEFGNRFALTLVYNTGGAGGYSFGPATWYLNVAITLLALVVMATIARELGRIHPMATMALGLVAGGAAGNLASMMSGPAGVADFIAINLPDRSIVFNVADVALWLGALLLVPVGVSLVKAIRSERARQNRPSAVSVSV